MSFLRKKNSSVSNGASSWDWWVFRQKVNLTHVSWTNVIHLKPASAWDRWISHQKVRPVDMDEFPAKKYILFISSGFGGKLIHLRQKLRLRWMSFPPKTKSHSSHLDLVGNSSTRLRMGFPPKSKSHSSHPDLAGNSSISSSNSSWDGCVSRQNIWVHV